MPGRHGGRKIAHGSTEVNAAIIGRCLARKQKRIPTTGQRKRKGDQQMERGLTEEK